MTTINTNNARAGRGLWPRLGLPLLVAALAGCDTEGLVQLTDPDIITTPVARDTANVNELRNGVMYEFARAMAGPAANNETPGIVGISGLMADELWYASTFNTMQDIDARRVVDPNNSSVTVVYQRIHRARNLAERAQEQFAAAGRTNSADAALLSNLAGFTYIFLAENFCSGVPLSATSLLGETTFGPPQTTQALLDSASNRFATAQTQAAAAGNDAQRNLARVGAGRALLAAGRFAEAAAAVAPVPTNFVFNVPYSESSSGQNNGLWYNINSERRSSAASGEGRNGIVFFRRGSPPNTIDPRASADSIGVGLSTLVPLYRQNKYPTRGTGIPLATGVEARLIEAEAALNKGASAAYLPIVNALRSSAGLAALTDPGTAAGRTRQFFQERAFFLWLTAHRLGDLRRMVRHYGFSQADVFPTGQTVFGTPYGSDVNFPIPFQESNNPEAPQAQCIDRNA